MHRRAAPKSGRTSEGNTHPATGLARGAGISTRWFAAGRIVSSFWFSSAVLFALLVVLRLGSARLRVAVLVASLVFLALTVATFYLAAAAQRHERPH